jgi:hypothetical protein
MAAVFAQVQGPQPTASSAEEDSLKTFLQNYLRTSSSEINRTTRYSDAFADLNGDGRREAIVYVSGRGWCGSGGCNTLILAPAANSYKVIANITITWPPVSVLTQTSNGWRNISVGVGGGGIRPGYEAELRFNGKTYPMNPTVPPARPLADTTGGEVVIRSGEGSKPLYSDQ